jgi:hypothetical protein
MLYVACWPFGYHVVLASVGLLLIWPKQVFCAVRGDCRSFSNRFELEHITLQLHGAGSVDMQMRLHRCCVAQA